MALSQQKLPSISFGEAGSSHESNAIQHQQSSTEKNGQGIGTSPATKGNFPRGLKQQAEVEAPPVKGSLPRGYHKLAAFMGKSRQVSIFRRFGSLTMFNLLSLQAELVELERDFQDIRQVDDSSSDQVREGLSLSFHDLRASKKTFNDDQLKKLEEIQPKLGKYHDALLQAADLFKLDTAPDEKLKGLTDWITHPKQGGDFMTGGERFAWGNAADLVTLYDYKGLQDPAPSWLTNTVLEWIPRLLSSTNTRKGQVDIETGATFYDIERDRINRLSTIVAAVVSSAFPMLAIMVLYWVKSTIKRLGISIAFTTTFAIALSLFGAKRIEIFAGTASFAAIEVVFIGTVSYSAT